MTLTVLACFNELQLKSFCVIREQETRVNLLINFLNMQFTILCQVSHLQYKLTFCYR